MSFDEEWERKIKSLVGKWPGSSPPDILNGVRSVEWTLPRERLFISLFRTCAESLPAKNSSRLSAMQRTETDIGDMFEELGQRENERHQAETSKSCSTSFPASSRSAMQMDEPDCPSETGMICSQTSVQLCYQHI